MVMIRHSKINYANLTDKQLKHLYLKYRRNADYTQSNQLTCLIDYLSKSNRIEAVLKC